MNGILYLKLFILNGTLFRECSTEHVWRHYDFKKTDLQAEKLTSTDSEYDETAEENKKLYCTFCKNYVTDSDAGISINGEQSHTFSNPAGYAYTVNCFQSAPGCMIIGEGTYEFTWFKGCAWQIALCHSCKEQLGWLFSNGQEFYALITDHLSLEQ
jgi:Yippee zinc-binding/DNA-binding /Mis18, centromere assembly